MKNTFKTLLAATAFVALTSPAFAEVVRTETDTVTSYMSVKDDYTKKNTTNRGHGRHYNAFSNDYRQPESLASAQVVAVQQELALKGFYDGKIDGILNAETKSAIRSYQEANGLSTSTTLNTAALEDMGLLTYEKKVHVNGGPVVTDVTTTTTTKTIR